MASVPQFMLDLGKEIATDKEVQTQALVSIIQATTGAAPEVDRKNPLTNVIILTDKHADLVDALFSKGTKAIASGPNKGKPPKIKINADKITNKLIYKRILPTLLTVFAGGALVGYLLKK